MTPSTATRRHNATRSTTPTCRTTSCRTIGSSRSTTRTQIDLQGQAASESDGHRHLTGTGGQLQFVRGAYASKGGKSFICLASTYDKRGEPRSRIVLNLTPGNVVTTPRTDVMYVVTEYGMVNLKGKSVAERALALISIAHPAFREQLEREAREKNIIPRYFFTADRKLGQTATEAQTAPARTDLATNRGAASRPETAQRP